MRTPPRPVKERVPVLPGAGPGGCPAPAGRVALSLMPLERLGAHRRVLDQRPHRPCDRSWPSASASRSRI